MKDYSGEEVEQKEIIIVGGGICGLATALALHRKGMKSVIIERAEKLRASGTTIIIHPNGWRALEHLGVASKLRHTALSIQKTAQYIALDSGVCKKMPLGDGELRCLRRADLMQALADDLPPDTIRFGCKMCSIHLNPLTSYPNMVLHDGSSLHAMVVIGCDGIKSVVADFVGMNSTRVFSTCAIRGVTRYSSGHKFQNQYVVMSKGNVQLARMPINDNLVYWFVTRRWTSQCT